ncbi:MAG TPA: MarR family transcriptional regulator [Dehalococcoidia bacterium]|nr:MarR family transcriptional regulator [Dehalococcoidia bacterium]
MENKIIDSILDSMAQVLPLFHRKLLRMDLGGISGDLSRLHFGIMEILSERDMTVTELARMTSMSKSQMTAAIDKLVKLDVLERHPDEKDRRVINIVLTEHGRILLREVRRKIKQNIKQILSSLTPDELAEMSAALKTLKEIGAKLQF